MSSPPWQRDEHRRSAEWKARDEAERDAYLSGILHTIVVLLTVGLVVALIVLKP